MARSASVTREPTDITLVYGASPADPVDEVSTLPPHRSAAVLPSFPISTKIAMPSAGRWVDPPGPGSQMGVESPGSKLVSSNIGSAWLSNDVASGFQLPQ